MFHIVALSKGTIFAKSADLFQEHADLSKINGILVQKGIFSKNTLVSALT